MVKKTKRRRTFIKAWRTHRGLTQEELAERVDVTQPSIARVERADNGYTQELLEKLAVALGCEPADLISGPPGPADDLRDAIAGLDQTGQKQALAVVNALKASRIK